MLRNIGRDGRTAILALAFFTALTGLAYPLAITGVGRAAFGHQAAGSVVAVGGRDVGSSLVGQNFTSPAYFHSRPSAAGTDGYDASASSGSNLGPSSRALADRVATAVAVVRTENGLEPQTKVPVDAVTASGSGLDPHISPAYADLQVHRVATARGLADDAVRALVRRNSDGATLGVLGESRVNVLLLNIAMDAAYGPPDGAGSAR